MNTISQNWTIGMDLGDKSHQICILDEDGIKIREESITNRMDSLKLYFGDLPLSLVVMETGTHSPWIALEIEKLGHKVLVANPYKLKAIWASDHKSDVRDAEILARIGRFDPELLYPIHHKGLQAHLHLTVLRTRDALVKCRTLLINNIRGSIKKFGYRIQSCSASSFHNQADIPESLFHLFDPMIQIIADLTAKINSYDKFIECISEENYPETKRLRQIKGVGPLTALTFVLTLDDPHRFEQSRDVGPYIGLVPRRSQSGEVDRLGSITKAGNPQLRRHLVCAANYIMGPFGPDCELKRFGERVTKSSCRNKAKVAVARKLSILMHRIWVEKEDYDPWYNSPKEKINVA